MTRNLIVCTDGTWNRPAQRDHGLIVPSNVVKIARAVSGHTTGCVKQLVYYDTGVGTGGRWDRFKGAFGYGLADNVKQAYMALGKTFQIGDRIFLFGFSRGAYTVRSLAGLIGLCGIPKKDCDLVSICEQAFQIYRLSPQNS